MRVIGIVVALILLTTGSIAEGPSAKPKALSRDNAIRRAREFCKAVGWTPKGKPDTKLETDFFPDRWQVEFYSGKPDADDTISIDINRWNGHILGAVNFAASAELEKSTQVKITESQAKASVSKYLKLAGVSMDGAVLESSKAGFDEVIKEEFAWNIEYRREYKGHRFYTDGLGITLNPRDATLESFGAQMDSPRPASVKVVIQKPDAEERARKYIPKYRNIDSLNSSELFIVQPNNFFETGKWIQKPVSSRLAWVVKFTWDKGHEAEVWVDAENGRVLGGMSCD